MGFGRDDVEGAAPGVRGPSPGCPARHRERASGVRVVASVGAGAGEIGVDRNVFAPTGRTAAP